MQDVKTINPQSAYQIVYEVDDDNVVIEIYHALVYDGVIQDTERFAGKKMLVAPLYRGMIKPKWTDDGWVDVATEEDIANSHIELPTSDTEILGQQMTERELEAMSQGQQITDVEIRVMALEMGANQL